MSTLKHVVSEKLNVPVRQQRLLFKGKALAGNGKETPREPRRKSGDGMLKLSLGSSVMDGVSST